MFLDAVLRKFMIANLTLFHISLYILLFLSWSCKIITCPHFIGWRSNLL